MKKYSGTLGFEIEINIVDSLGNIVNLIDNKPASSQIIGLLQSDPKYKEIVKRNGGDIVKPELDASQIEIYNRRPNVSLGYLQDELCKAFELVQGVVSDFGLCIAEQVVPHQDFVPIPSSSSGRYQQIHDMLSNISLEHRKSTNITGTHMTYEAGSAMHNHITVSQYVRDRLLSSHYDQLGICPFRLEKYNTVVDALRQLGMVNVGSIPSDIRSEEDIRSKQMSDGKDISSYELVRKKTIQIGGKDICLSEMRVVDGPISVGDIVTKTELCYTLLLNALDEYRG